MPTQLLIATASAPPIDLAHLANAVQELTAWQTCQS